MNDPTISPGLRARLALQKHGFRFSHALGQNFILDDRWINLIAEAAGALPGDHIVEIGPGAGVMTAHIAERGTRVLAVELDESLRPVLDEVLAGLNNIQLIYADALKLDIGRAARDAFGDEPYRVVANLPYYITSELMYKLVSEGARPADIAVMVQREAADRIMARPGEKQYCALAAAVQHYGLPQIALQVPPEAFTPRPHVDSCVLRVTRHAVPPANPADEALFFKLIQASFAMRRKTLANNLSAAFQTPRDRVLCWMATANLDEKVRGEALTLQQLTALSDAMTQDGVRSN